MRFRFSLRTTIICAVLTLGMVRASYWQWERHNSKLAYIKNLESRLEMPVEEASFLSDSSISLHEKTFRRVKIEGSYDFKHEMILRNRRHNEDAGVYVVTPLKLKDLDRWVLVNRGFLPLQVAKTEARKPFQKPDKVSFIGLIKASAPRKIFSPKDLPTGPGHPWVDSWLRVDVENIGKQLPYAILPMHLEIMDTLESTEVKSRITESRSARDDIFLMPAKGITTKETPSKSEHYPIPIFDTVVPPGRHLGYVFEWAIMAVVTVLIGIVLQLRRPKVGSK